MVLEVAMLEDIDGLHAAILHRGILAGHRFYVPESSLDEVKQHLAGELIAYPNAVQALQHAPTSCVWLGTAATAEDRFPDGEVHVKIQYAHEPSRQGFDGTVLVVHDMLPPPSNSEEAVMFDQWARACQSNTAPTLTDRRRYWCSVSDVASAMIRSLPHLNGKITYHIAGRRGWTLAETFAEFSKLARRTLAGASGAFRREHLLPDSGPAVQPTPVAEHDSQEGVRPDIASFHRFLEDATGEGWRPIMPLRQTLMLVLAGMDGTQA